MADNVPNEDKECSCILSVVFLFSLHKCMKELFIVLVLCQGRKQFMGLTFSGLDQNTDAKSLLHHMTDLPHATQETLNLHIVFFYLVQA